MDYQILPVAMADTCFITGQKLRGKPKRMAIVLDDSGKPCLAIPVSVDADKGGGNGTDTKET